MAVGRGDLGAPPGPGVATARRRPGLQEGRTLDGGERAEVGHRRRPLHLGHPAVLGVGQADPEVQAQRLGHVVAQGRAQGAPVHAAEDFAGHIAVDHRVVARRRPGRPERRHGGDPGGDGVPVEPQGRVHRLGEGGQTVLVRQALFDGDVPLAALGELGPDFRDLLAVIQAALADQAADHHGGDRLGGGEHRRQGVRPEGRPGDAVGEPGHQVDDDLALDGGREAGAQLLALGEIGDEGVAHGHEAVRADAPDLDGRRHQPRRSIRTIGEAALILAPMATTGSSGVFHMAADATVSATPPVARARA